jgi:alkyldihydroxyacetonephosphate synthase
LKNAVSEAIVAWGGTISHQHGVGLDHAPWLHAEKGPLGMDALRALFRQFDPDGCMNPGKLVTP